MNKSEFLEKLNKKLIGLPYDDIKKSLDYYGEMIDDRVEDGISEEDAVAQIGNVDEIAKQIIGEAPLSKIILEKAKGLSKTAPWKIILLVITAPIWLSLLVALCSVIFSVIASVVSAVITLYCITLALGAGTFGGLIGGAVLIATHSIMQGVFLIGAGIFCLGAFLIGFALSKFITKTICKYTKKLILFIKHSFFKKEEI